jgi:hypothetical protein
MRTATDIGSRPNPTPHSALQNSSKDVDSSDISAQLAEEGEPHTCWLQVLSTPTMSLGEMRLVINSLF